MAHPDVIINGVVYQAAPQVNIPVRDGGTAEFYAVDGATAQAAHVLEGEVFVGLHGEDVGAMPENGAVGGTISTKGGTVAIPAGHTSGGTVSIAPAAVADLTPAALLAGKSVLGVDGTVTLPSISQDAVTKIISIS